MMMKEDDDKLETLSVTSACSDDGSVVQLDGSGGDEETPSEVHMGGASGKLSTRTATCVLINFISVGYILIPSAFAQGGLLLATISMIFVSLQSLITGVYVLEACSRAEALKVSLPAFLTLREVDADDDASEEPSRSPRRQLPRHHSVRIHQRTYELSELCRIFLGRWPRNFFTLTTAGDLYGISWAFAAVFGSSLSEHLPLGTDWDYQLYIGIFMAISIPIACMNIDMQLPMQIFFLVARTFMVLLMLGTLIAAYASDEPHFDIQDGPSRTNLLFNFSTIVTVMQLCVFSTAYQFSVPGLASATKNKRRVSNALKGGVFYICLSNIVLSLVMALYFGPSTQASSNLNWLNYHGGTWDGTGDFSRAWWATGISSYIVLFAAIDGLAVYPLIAASLGDILMGAAYEDNVHRVQNDWRVRIVFRLMASFPQAIGSLFLKDLGVIAKYAGIFTLLSYTVCPSCIYLKSKQVMIDHGLPEKTRYQSAFSRTTVAWALIGLAGTLIIGVIVESIADGFADEAATSSEATIALNDGDSF